MKSNTTKPTENSAEDNNEEMEMEEETEEQEQVRASAPHADVNERKTSLEIVPISKISNSRGADQKYKLNCSGKAIMYGAKNLNNHVMPHGLP
ncbi:hypothetical protein J6590_065293 [Homalodisca vitripennis]|nr:hypothetical protein J6590_065293 [Homalodisca vitripennis]